MDTQTCASRIKLVAFDIDGVMTDGGLHDTDDGHELKTFNVQDGLGLKLLQRAGIDLAAIAECGFSIAPANVRPLVRQRAHAVTEAAGGHGAVREAAEFTLAGQGQLDSLFAAYLDPQ